MIKTVIHTSRGLLSDAIFVNPTISLKNIVTISKLSAVTRSPLFNTSATGLFNRNSNQHYLQPLFDQSFSAHGSSETAKFKLMII